MTINLDEFRDLQSKVEEAKRDLARDEGSLRTLMETLKKDFGCESIKEAQTLLKKLETEEESLSKEIETKMRQFEEDWGETFAD